MTAHNFTVERREKKNKLSDEPCQVLMNSISQKLQPARRPPCYDTFT